MKTKTYSLLKIGTAALLCASLGACETVANVAQNVADSARGKPQASQPEQKPTGSASAPQAVPTSSSTAATRGISTCASGFTVTGSFFTGKQMKASTVLPTTSADIAYRKAYAEIVKRGYQIVQADKEIRMISANQAVSFSKGGKTVPVNVLIESDGASGKGSRILISVNLPGGLVASEDSVRDEFCDISKIVGS